MQVILVRHTRVDVPRGVCYGWSDVPCAPTFEEEAALTRRVAEIINSQIRYSMSDEYYMIERYADNDPYYTPWSPNFSANGRTISMLLDLCAG